LNVAATIRAAGLRVGAFDGEGAGGVALAAISGEDWARAVLRKRERLRRTRADHRASMAADRSFS
jgi:hypothetical protein